MALPTLGAKPRYIEELRIGGGYLSTPDGGVDIDKAGNIAMNGDLTIDGDLALGPAGVDRTWCHVLTPRAASLAVTGAAQGPLDTNHGTFAANFGYLAFDAATREWAHWTTALPASYDGAALKFTLFWFAPAGTASGNVIWRVRAVCMNDGAGSAASTGSGVGVTDAIDALNQIHATSVTVTPQSAASGGLLAFSVERTADTDTFNADACLIAVRVAYA